MNVDRVIAAQLMNCIADALDCADRLPGSRDLSMVKTKLDEAILWGNRVVAGLEPAANEALVPGETILDPEGGTHANPLGA